MSDHDTAAFVNKVFDGDLFSKRGHVVKDSGDPAAQFGAFAEFHACEPRHPLAVELVIRGQRELDSNHRAMLAVLVANTRNFRIVLASAIAVMASSTVAFHSISYSSSVVRFLIYLLLVRQKSGAHFIFCACFGGSAL